ncbi:MAG: hypothetical protein GXP38_03995 [Chloroflexi bacterium]|nr:hypothetical protein [Chloroflexota bacterium]
MRTLILYASIGSGHRVSADAIAEALRKAAPQMEVAEEDVLGPGMDLGDIVPDILSALATALFPSIYNRLWANERLAEIAKHAYELQPIKDRILRVLKNHRPDIVICTHAFPCAVAAQCNADRDAADRFLLIGVPTDYHIHPYWPIEYVSAYAVPTNTAQGILIDRGFPAERVQALGIPIRNNFSVPLKPAEERQKLGLGPEEKVVTILAGGGRPGPYMVILPKVLQIANIISNPAYTHTRWQFICGNGSPIEGYLRNIAAETTHIRVFGYVDHIETFLHASDIVATKPGGLIVSETLAAGKPIALLTLGAGQEAANAAFLQDMGVALYAETTQGLIDHICKLLADSRRLRQLQHRALTLGRPHAARQLALWVLDLYQREKGESGG